MISADELSMRMIDDIRRDQLEGIVPNSVERFSALHEYVDANTYGGVEQLLEDVTAVEICPEPANRRFGDFILIMNDAIELIDKHFVATRLNRGL